MSKERFVAKTLGQCEARLEELRALRSQMIRLSHRMADVRDAIDYGVADVEYVVLEPEADPLSPEQSLAIRMLVRDMEQAMLPVSVRALVSRRPVKA